jgi:hypothetical protein
MFEKKPSGWEVTGYDPGGKPFAVCTLAGKKLQCTKP